MQELVNRPPTAGTAARGRGGGGTEGGGGGGVGVGRFAGRDWRDVAVGELLGPSGEEDRDVPDVWWADMETSVEEATRVSSFGCEVVVMTSEANCL